MSQPNANRQPPARQQQQPQPGAREADRVDAALPAVLKNMPALQSPMCRDVQSLQQQVRALSGRVHLLSPTIDPSYVPEFHEVSIRLVDVDDRVEEQGGRGDVYRAAGWKPDERALTRHALDRIAGAAGLSWDPLRSGRVDDGSDPYYCHFRAVGYVRDLDGSRRTVTGEKVIDLRDGHPSIFTADESRMKRKWIDSGPNRGANGPIENPGFVKGWSEQRLSEARLHMVQMAETKAKNRVIRSLGVKQKYRADELQKPFAVLALVLTGASSDPQMERLAKERMLDAALQTSREIYGADAPGQRQLRAPEETPAPAEVRTAPPALPSGPVVPEIDDDEREPDTEGDGRDDYKHCGCPDGPAGQHELGCRLGGGE